jgi:hypothetical protein
MYIYGKLRLSCKPVITGNITRGPLKIYSPEFDTGQHVNQNT